MPSHSRVVSRIDQTELHALAIKYGQPLRRHYFIEADTYMRAYRGQQDPDRRGEVVFAIRQPNGEILLHTKHHYEKPIYRLPSGGIERDEPVEDALFREIAEEIGQFVKVRSFVGVLDCNFVCDHGTFPFVSYIFFLDSLSMELRPTDTVEVAGYKTVPACELGAVAHSLRALDLERRCWGYWRSLAHDLVHNALACCTQP